MNRKTITYTLTTLLMGALAGLNACSTKTEDYPVDPTLQLIAAHEWKIKDIKVPAYNGGDSVISKNCHINGAHIFFSLNNQYSFEDSTFGGCDTTVFPYDKGVWGLKIARDSMLFAGTKNKFMYGMKLLMVNNDSLRLRYLDSTAFVVKTLTLVK